MTDVSCHCGAIVLTVRHLPDTLTECNCSICRRLGALWAYYLPEDITVSAAPETMVGYRRGEGNIEFTHCKTCGCTTHYTNTQPSTGRKMALNGRLFPNDVVRKLPIRRFDGAETWAYLE